MISTFELFGRTIPLYGICCTVGIGLAVLVALWICKQINFDPWEIIYSAVYTLVGALIGSKLLFIIVSWDTVTSGHIPLQDLLLGGFVFYGGLIGGLAALVLYTLIYKVKLVNYLEIYAAVLPLGHAFGRVGCFFGTCCYGIPSDFGVIYNETLGVTPLGVKLFPVQLVEAACLLVLFEVLMFLFFRCRRNGVVTLTYCFSYSVIRFTLEFLRGDAERGALLGLSTSQWISILMALAAIAGLVLRRVMMKKKAAEATSEAPAASA